jgi:adenosine deaminase
LFTEVLKKYEIFMIIDMYLLKYLFILKVGVEESDCERTTRQSTEQKHKQRQK